MKLYLINCNKCGEKQPHFIYAQRMRGGIKLCCDVCGTQKNQYIKRNIEEYKPEIQTKSESGRNFNMEKQEAKSALLDVLTELDGLISDRPIGKGITSEDYVQGKLRDIYSDYFCDSFCDACEKESCVCKPEDFT